MYVWSVPNTSFGTGVVVYTLGGNVVNELDGKYSWHERRYT